jgi:hypothetical protein
LCLQGTISDHYTQNFFGKIWQFPDMAKARTAYRALLARVRAVEAARQADEFDMSDAAELIAEIRVPDGEANP